MEVGSLTRTSADLHLFVFDRPLHPELFRQYGSYRITQTRYYADVWVVGLSHVLTITAGPVSMTELLSADSDVLPSRGVVTRFRLKGERDLERRLPDGWHYMVSSQVETMDEPLYKSVHQDLVKHAMKRGCLTQYEDMAEAGELTPFTYIDHEARNGEFHLHAFHAFPHERTLVKTQTIVELPA